MDSARSVLAEGIGTAMLLATVVGSGMMGARLSGGNIAIALLANTIANGAALVALILTFGSNSEAHFNSTVTLADAPQGGPVGKTSTSFANPAVALARAAGDTFAGIRPADAQGFIAAQVLRAATATALFRRLVPSTPEEDAPAVVVPHHSRRGGRGQEEINR